jgi:predicted HicB family RNase H-like nuclease
MATEKLTITIDKDVRRTLQNKADKEHRSLSNYISWKLKQLIREG